MLKTTITRLRQIAFFAVGGALLTACGNNQSGMKLGDNEFAVLAVHSTTSDQSTSYAGYRDTATGFGVYC